MINHANSNVDHKLLNISLEQENKPDPALKYQKQSGKLDLSILGITTNNCPVHHDVDYICCNSPIDREEANFLTREEKREIINKINQKDQGNMVGELTGLDFYSEEDEEDNDTDNDERENRINSMEFLKEQEG